VASSSVAERGSETNGRASDASMRSSAGSVFPAALAAAGSPAAGTAGRKPPPEALHAWGTDDEDAEGVWGGDLLSPAGLETALCVLHGPNLSSAGHSARASELETICEDAGRAAEVAVTPRSRTRSLRSSLLWGAALELPAEAEVLEGLETPRGVLHTAGSTGPLLLEAMHFVAEDHVESCAGGERAALGCPLTPAEASVGERPPSRARCATPPMPAVALLAPQGSVEMDAEELPAADALALRQHARGGEAAVDESAAGAALAPQAAPGDAAPDKAAAASARAAASPLQQLAGAGEAPLESSACAVASTTPAAPLPRQRPAGNEPPLGEPLDDAAAASRAAALQSHAPGVDGGASMDDCASGREAKAAVAAPEQREPARIGHRQSPLEERTSRDWTPTAEPAAAQRPAAASALVAAAPPVDATAASQRALRPAVGVACRHADSRASPSAAHSPERASAGAAQSSARVSTSSMFPPILRSHDAHGGWRVSGGESADAAAAEAGSTLGRPRPNGPAEAPAQQHSFIVANSGSSAGRPQAPPQRPAPGAARRRSTVEELIDQISALRASRCEGL